jgi:hypothetical protein
MFYEKLFTNRSLSGAQALDWHDSCRERERERERETLRHNILQNTLRPHYLLTEMVRPFIVSTQI